MEQTIGTIRYPYMRLDLREYTNSLRDEKHQKQVWIEHQPSAKRDSFSNVVHFFYDDTTLASDPGKCIGLFLRDASEMAAIRALISAMDALFAELGTRRPDEDYLRAPGWPQVVRRAKELGVLLDRPDDST